jgi:hypothetical protein
MPVRVVLMRCVISNSHETYQNPFYPAVHQRIGQLLTQALVQGETVNLDVSFTADAMLAAIMPTLYNFQRRFRDFSRERILAGMRRLFIEGLRVHAQTATDREDKR